METAIVITLADITGRWPEVARWRALYERVAQAAGDRSPEDLIESLLSPEDLDNNNREELTALEVPGHTALAPVPALPDRIMELFNVAYVTYGPTVNGNKTDDSIGKKWLTIPEVANILQISPSTVRHYAEVFTTEGKLVTKLDKHRPLRKGRRPRLYALNPKFTESPHERNRREDQEAPGPRRKQLQSSRG